MAATATAQDRRRRAPKVGARNIIVGRAGVWRKAVEMTTSERKGTSDGKASDGMR